MTTTTVIEAPFSFVGSAKRIWKMTNVDNTGAKVALGSLAVMLIFTAWMGVLTWYCMFGFLVVPFRLFRRGQRRDKALARIERSAHAHR